MKKLVTAAGLVLMCTGVHAQQGHPLQGIWLGDWGAGNDRNQVVVELNWFDTSLTGMINPGYPDEGTIVVGELDSADNWRVHLEATGTDGDGKPFRTVIEGHLENLGSANREMKGTWTQGGVNGDFVLRRE